MGNLPDHHIFECKADELLYSVRANDAYARQRCRRPLFQSATCSETSSRASYSMNMHGYDEEEDIERELALLMEAIRIEQTAQGDRASPSLPIPTHPPSCPLKFSSGLTPQSRTPFDKDELQLVRLSRKSFLRRTVTTNPSTALPSATPS